MISYTQPAAIKLAELIQDAIEAKDAEKLSRIVQITELTAGECITVDGPLDTLYDVRDKIGEEKICKELSEMLAKRGVKGYENAKCIDDFYNGRMDLTAFYPCLMTLMLKYPKESGISSERKEQFAEDMLDFVDGNCGEEFFEDILHDFNDSSWRPPQ